MLIGLIGIFFVPQTHGSYVGPELRATDDFLFYHDFDKPVIQANTENQLILRVGARSANSLERSDRMPLNLAIVLDKSGSMGGQAKLENAKLGAIEMVSRLNENDVVSLVVFDSRARVLVHAQKARHKEHIIRKIHSVRAYGSTALYSGIELGSRQLSRYASSDNISRIVLLSDGLANVGPQTNAEIFQLGERLIGRGMHVSAIGLGLDFNEQLLTGLTVNSGGNYYYTNSSDDLPDIFRREIDRSVTIVARDIRIRVYADNGARMLGAIGPANREEELMVETWIPFLYGGDDQYRLVELAVPRVYEGDSFYFGHIVIEYFDPVDQEDKVRQYSLRVDVSDNPRLVRQRMNKDVIKDAYIRRSAEYKEKAMRLARQGNYQAASRILIDSSNELENAAVLCDNDKDLYRVSEKTRVLSDDVIRRRGFSKRMMKSEVLNSNMEFWGN